MSGVSYSGERLEEIPLAGGCDEHLRGKAERGAAEARVAVERAVISILAMLTAGILELVRLHVIATRGFSIFRQVPQYFVISTGEVFTFVGQLEFFYDQAPDAMVRVGLWVADGGGLRRHRLGIRLGGGENRSDGGCLRLLRDRTQVERASLVHSG